MKMTEHFDISEFDCHDGIEYPKKSIVKTLLPLCISLERIREAIGHPIYIMSGYRTPSHNRNIGGARHSYHMDGCAADLVVHGIPPLQLYNTISKMMADEEIKTGGLGLYIWGCHYDQRGYPARWNKPEGVDNV